MYGLVPKQKEGKEGRYNILYMYIRTHVVVHENCFKEGVLNESKCYVTLGTSLGTWDLWVSAV